MTATRFTHDGIEGLRVGRFPGGLTTACIVYRIGDTVIDTGPPNQWRQVRRFLNERQVRQAIVTHHHEDHGGNLGRIGHDLEADQLAPESGIAALESGFPLRLYQHLVWGKPPIASPRPLPDRIDLDGGRALRPVATPGHSPDSTSYLDSARGLIFTGDLYIAGKVRYLRSDEDLGAMIDSLRKVGELDFETVLCAHRGVVADGKAALARKRDFLESMVERVTALAAAGQSAREITQRLLGREDLMSWITGFHFAKRHLINACLALATQRAERESESA